MKKTKQTVSFILAVLVALFFVIDAQTLPQTLRPAPVLSAQAARHMLHGDQRGGGHLHGTGKPCKSEFPADWDADEVTTHVKSVAANDNLDWEKQDNYYVAEQAVEDTRVRVVLNRDRSGIVTAYPTNVKRNPCPRAANDNRRP